MSKAQESFESALAAMGTMRPVFLIRRARCGCRLGAVHHSKLIGYVVAGRRQGTGQDKRPDGSVGMGKFRSWYVQSLEQPHGPEWWGCAHGEGMLPLDELLASARDTSRQDGPFVIES